MKFFEIPSRWQLRIEQAIDAASDEAAFPIEIDRNGNNDLVVGCTKLGEVDVVSSEYSIRVERESFVAKKR